MDDKKEEIQLPTVSGTPTGNLTFKKVAIGVGIALAVGGVLTLLSR